MQHTVRILGKDKELKAQGNILTFPGQEEVS